MMEGHGLAGRRERLPDVGKSRGGVCKTGRRMFQEGVRENDLSSWDGMPVGEMVRYISQRTL